MMATTRVFSFLNLMLSVAYPMHILKNHHGIVTSCTQKHSGTPCSCRIVLTNMNVYEQVCDTGIQSMYFHYRTVTCPKPHAHMSKRKLVSQLKK